VLTSNDPAAAASHADPAPPSSRAMSEPKPNTPAQESEAQTAARALLGRTLGDGAFTASMSRDNLRIHVTKDRLIETLTALRDEGGYRLLSELGGTDYLKYPGKNGSGCRFEVHYVLRNVVTAEFVVVKVGVTADEPILPSAVPLWSGADWMEREVFDMFGIRFQGHPDLRRILMPDEFTAYPLRKDYPLRGRGERHNFPRLSREQS
jgi:NADH-quinone oxidoreductase subunit C